MTATRGGYLRFEGLDTNSMKRPWNNRLIFTFFLSYLAIIVLLSVGFFFSIPEIWCAQIYVASLGKVMEQKTSVIARLLPWESEPGSLDLICKNLANELGVRITVIALDGTVIGDSDESARELEKSQRPPGGRGGFDTGKRLGLAL